MILDGWSQVEMTNWQLAGQGVGELNHSNYLIHGIPPAYTMKE